LLELINLRSKFVGGRGRTRLNVEFQWVEGGRVIIEWERDEVATNSEKGEKFSSQKHSWEKT